MVKDFRGGRSEAGCCVRLKAQLPCACLDGYNKIDDGGFSRSGGECEALGEDGEMVAG